MVNAKRGSVLWVINHFREGALNALVADLHKLEERGLSPKECKRVQDHLAEVVSVAAKIPSGTYWQQSVYREFERFQETYVIWNSHPADAPAHRRRDLKKLRRRKIAISTRIRNHQPHLMKLLEIGVVVEMYEALARIASDMPQLFPKLTTSVERFRSRLAG